MNLVVGKTCRKLVDLRGRGLDGEVKMIWFVAAYRCQNSFLPNVSFSFDLLSTSSLAIWERDLEYMSLYDVWLVIFQHSVHPMLCLVVAGTVRQSMIWLENLASRSNLYFEMKGERSVLCHRCLSTPWDIQAGIHKNGIETRYLMRCIWHRDLMGQ